MDLDFEEVSRFTMQTVAGGDVVRIIDASEPGTLRMGTGTPRSTRG